MSKCMHCGKELPEGIELCANCSEYTPNTGVQPLQTPHVAVPPEKSRRSFMIGLCAALAIFLLASLAVLLIWQPWKGSFAETTSCGDLQAPLPYGLQFGMTETQFVKSLQTAGMKVPALRSDSSGYTASISTLNRGGAEALFGITGGAQTQTQKSMVSSFSFVFSGSKVLNGFIWQMTTESDSDAENLLNALASEFVPRYGFSGISDGVSEDSSYIWTNTQFRVTVFYDAAQSRLTVTVDSLPHLGGLEYPTVPSVPAPPVTTAQPVSKDYTEIASNPQGLFLVRVTDPNWPVFDGPSYGFSQNGTVKEASKYTIVAEAVDSYGTQWGKLKSGAGWIDLTGLERIYPEVVQNKVTLGIERAPEFISPSDYEHVIDASSDPEYGYYVLITADKDLYDLALYQEDTYTSGYGKLHGKISYLKGNTAFLIRVYFPGPGFGGYILDFKDAQGAQYSLYIGESGKDGEPFLTDR